MFGEDQKDGEGLRIEAHEAVIFFGADVLLDERDDTFLADGAHEFAVVFGIGPEGDLLRKAGVFEELGEADCFAGFFLHEGT